MNLRKIHKGFVSGRLSLILTLLAFIAFRLTANRGESPLVFWSVAGIQTGISFFLLFLTQEFVIIRQRTLLPTFFYLLLIGTNPALFYSLQGSVCALIIVLCLFFLLKAYQDQHAQGTAFNISILLTLGSLYWFPILLLFPLFLYGMYRFRNLNGRTFAASLTGFIFIYWLLFAWSIYQNDWTIFLDRLPDFNRLYPIDFFTFSLKEWITMGFIFLLCVLAGTKLFMSGISEKIRTIAILTYLYVFSIVLFLLFFLQSGGKTEWAPILYIPISFLLAHYFTLSSQKGTIWLFLITLLFFLSSGFIFD